MRKFTTPILHMCFVQFLLFCSALAFHSRYHKRGKRNICFMCLFVCDASQSALDIVYIISFRSRVFVNHNAKAKKKKKKQQQHQLLFKGPLNCIHTIAFCLFLLLFFVVVVVVIVVIVAIVVFVIVLCQITEERTNEKTT